MSKNKVEYHREPQCRWCGRRDPAHQLSYGRLRSRHTFDPETPQTGVRFEPPPPPPPDKTDIPAQTGTDSQEGLANLLEGTNRTLNPIEQIAAQAMAATRTPGSSTTSATSTRVRKAAKP